MAAEPTVFIVDDDAAVRDATRALIQSVGLRAVAFGSADEFLRGLDDSQPGCVILDLRMPDGKHGPVVQRELLERCCTLPVIFLTGYADVPTAVGAMKLGAVDVLEKPCSDEELIDRVRQAIARDAASRSERARTDDAAARLQKLTPRERDILGLVLAGKSSREIATEIFRTEKTVEFHRRNILKKLGVKKTIQLRDFLAAVQSSTRK